MLESFNFKKGQYYKGNIAIMLARRLTIVIKCVSFIDSSLHLCFCSRLDSSLIELLEVFSPISVPKRGNPPRRPPPFSAPKQAHHALLSRPGPYRTPKQDLEESQILEEIFFIC